MALLAGTVLLAGCGTGKNAVDQDSTYTFVSPGGKSEIFYDLAQRHPLPDLSGDNLDHPGQQIRLSDYPGQVIVLNIWGSWCAPCRAESPELQQVANQTAASGVRFIGIDVRDVRSAAQDFRSDYQITYPSIFDPPARSLLALRGYPRSVVPSTIVLDRHHRVAAVYLHALTAADLLPEVQKVAADKQAVA